MPQAVESRRDDEVSIDELELKGFSRSVAELEWLLLVLVLLYFVAPGMVVSNREAVVGGMCAFAAFTFAFRFLNFYRREAKWKIALETFAMIGFITWVLIFTGGVNSPLLNLYLLVIITSGLTLGKMVTLLEMGLITSAYLWLGRYFYSTAMFSLEHFSEIMSTFAPFLLVAYLTTMLSADLFYAKRAFRLLSQTDELTGLFNRRAFNRMLSQELAKAERYQRPFSLMMIDADGLKGINDQFGHEAGDRFIRHLGATVSSTLRVADTCARFGGDEFVVMLPETGPVQAAEVGNRILGAVNTTPFHIAGRRLNGTISVGIATYPQDAVSQEDILHKADSAMYVGKGEGGNRVKSFSDPA